MTEKPKSGGKSFRPNLVLTLIAMVMLSILIYLGTWQAGRYNEAIDTVESYRIKHHETPPVTTFAGTEGPDRREALHHRRVEVEGRVIVEEVQVVAAIYKFARPGYGLLAPFEVEGGPYKRILVYLGWVPQEKLGEFLESLKGVKITLGGRIQKVNPLIGNAAKPLEEKTEGHTTWRTANMSAMLQSIREHVDGLDPDIFIRAGEEASGKEVDLNDLPLNGYRHPLKLPPAKHIEYAVTWYGVGAALIAVWIAVSIRRKEDDEDGDASA